MRLFKPQKAKKSQIDTNDLLRILEENQYLSPAMIQREFTIGYAQATSLINALEEKGYIRFDGRRWIKA